METSYWTKKYHNPLVSYYEAAINAVIIQVEKYDPKISAKYWLSPFEVHDARVNILSRLRNQFGISTSLTILARIVNLKEPF